MKPIGEQSRCYRKLMPMRLRSLKEWPQIRSRHWPALQTRASFARRAAARSGRGRWTVSPTIGRTEMLDQQDHRDAI
jgi:hypothetical protein